MSNVMQILSLNRLLLFLLIAWSIVWKGLALWHSAREGFLLQSPWGPLTNC